MATPTRMTQLEAVNLILRSIGETAVTDLSSPTDDVQFAIDTLNETNKEVQTRGWHWNTETDVEVTPTANEIVLDSNVVRADVDRTSTSDPDWVFRNGKLYDRYNNTFTYTGATITVNRVVYLLDFEHLPEAAALYVARRAARLMTEDTQEDPTLIRKAQLREQDAWRQMTLDDAESGDYTIFDQRTIGDIVNRLSPLDEIGLY